MALDLPLGREVPSGLHEEEAELGALYQKLPLSTLARSCDLARELWILAHDDYVRS